MLPVGKAPKSFPFASGHFTVQEDTISVLQHGQFLVQLVRDRQPKRLEPVFEKKLVKAPISKGLMSDRENWAEAS